MNLEKVSAAFLVALVLCTGLATSPAHAAETAPISTLDIDAEVQPVAESFMMFDKDSTPENPKCLQVQRWITPIVSYDDDGKPHSYPFVRQVSRNTECTLEARPYESSWQAGKRLAPASQASAQIK